jgi:DNA helicase-2/ATP-dependent DNA helicase PcrA
MEFKNTIIKFKKDSESIPLGDLVEKIVNELGYIDYLQKSGERDRIANVKELIFSIKALDDDLDLEKYLEYISLTQATDELDQDNNFISLMTVHSSKGLEFKALFISGLEEELFPHSNSILSDNLEEERRLFYVALTRAKELLFLTYSRNRSQFSNASSYRERSRFIDEIPKDLFTFEKMDHPMKARSSEALFRAIEDMKKRKLEDKKKVEQDSKNHRDKLKQIIGFTLGERVQHKVFGEGQIISLSLDKISVLFATVGEKKFLSANASKFIEKIV